MAAVFVSGHVWPALGGNEVALPVVDVGAAECRCVDTREDVAIAQVGEGNAPQFDRGENVRHYRSQAITHIGVSSLWDSWQTG